MALNLNEFSRKYAEFNNMSISGSKTEIERFINTFKNLTISEGGINLTGFIKSEVVDVPAKKGRNPKTGETIDIAPKKVVKVKVAPKFKENKPEIPLASDGGMNGV